MLTWQARNRGFQISIFFAFRIEITNGCVRVYGGDSGSRFMREERAESGPTPARPNLRVFAGVSLYYRFVFTTPTDRQYKSEMNWKQTNRFGEEISTGVGPQGRAKLSTVEVYTWDTPLRIHVCWIVLKLIRFLTFLITQIKVNARVVLQTFPSEFYDV